MKLLIFGTGYTGGKLAERAAAAGARVWVTSRDPAGAAVGGGVEVLGFGEAAAVVAEATHIVATAPPGDGGDPVLARYRDALVRAPFLQWIGYYSTTGVYGDRGGGWVDEASAPAPQSARGLRRLEAEGAWLEVAGGRPLDRFRIAGIYGPGRNALVDLRADRARRVVKPGHDFSRIHRDDIVAATLAAMAHPPVAARVLHMADDRPAGSAEVLEEAARLLGVVAPPAVGFAEAWVGMSAMQRSFWAENRKVSNVATKAALKISWRYPSFREGLRACLETC